MWINRVLLLLAALLCTDGAPFLRNGFSRNSASSANETSSSNASVHNGTVANRPPRLYFLFLAVDKISNLKVWNNFFSQGPPSQYKVLVHCKLAQCNTYVQGSVFWPVPTVPSYYCTDLVSPMAQLLSYALSDDPGMTNPLDKFIYVSDSTLPAKPFAEIYSVYTWRPGSDFCAFPSNEWADIPGLGGLQMAVKVHQWITLSRHHAERANLMWIQGQMHDFMSKFQMNWNSYQHWSNNTYADNRNFGCLDEFWHMAALYGTLTHVDATRNAMVNLEGFTNGPLKVASATGWQGACDTFVVWSKYLYAAGENPFSRLHSSLDPASVPHAGNDMRPGWWDTMSSYGIHAIRNSEFLFVRKFIDNPRLANGGDFSAEYSRIVLGM